MAFVRVCFVCLGNICRSPTAEGVMRHLVARAGLDDRIEVESAGTAGYHVGEPADPRSRETAARRGIELTSRAQRFSRADFARFDHVIAMDRENLRALHALAPDASARSRLALMRAFDPEAGSDPDVPDPYYGGERGFDDVFDLCERACRALLEHLVAAHGLEPERRARG